MSRRIIRVIDFEGTGLDAGAQVCEMGWCDIDLDGFQVMEPAAALCRVDAIPPEVRAIHHIRAEATWHHPPYDRNILYEDAVRAGAVALAAHNVEYEERFITGNLPLVCTYKAALRHWPDAPGHSVFALLYWLEDAGRITFDRHHAYPPHRASADAYATAVLLVAMLTDGIRYPDRTDCARCYHQRIGEWFELWRDHRDIFTDAADQEVEMGATFRTPGRDTWPTPLREIAERFEAGEVPTISLDRMNRERMASGNCRVCTL